MFDLENYYAQAHSGNFVDNTEILTYIKKFKHIVIWGGSYLGKAIGEYLLKKGITLESYWDLRAEELKSVHGIQVISPFSTLDKENTLVLFCIANNVIRQGLLKKLSELGYKNVIRGDYFYMGALCPFDKTTGIESAQCQGSMCCRFIFCQRLSNIIKSKNSSANPLHMFSVTLIVNQRCSLSCKYCTSYMNAYPLEKRVDIPLEQICKDIDRFFSAMDSLGTVTVMGGEPFMHPQLDKIMQKLLEKQNFGLVSIATSGTYPIKERFLSAMHDRRVNVSFSNYLESIRPQQQEVFHKNVALVKKSGVSYTVGLTMPEWSIPSTLCSKHYSTEEMTARKAACPQPPRCMQIKNGKLYPCDFGTAVHSLEIADYPTDYINLHEFSSIAELQKQIRAYRDLPYYQVCGHCSGMKNLTAKAAEQGFLDFMKPLEH